MYTKAFGPGFSPVHGSSSGGNVGGDWSTISINGNGTFTLPYVGTYPLPSPGEMKKIPLEGDKFFKIRQRADGSYEGKFGPSPSQHSPAPAPAPAPPPPAPKFEPSFFQPAPQPKAPEHPAVAAALNFAKTAFQPAPEPKPSLSSFQPAVTAALHFAQTAFQPAPQPQPKAQEPKSSSFAPVLATAVKVAQAAFQAAPAPSSPGWSSVAINRNGTFTLPSVGTFPLPSPGEMKKIPLQGDKFFKIRQRADGSYEGKFGPDSKPAPQQHKAPEPEPTLAAFQPAPAPAPSSPGWRNVAVNRNGTFTLPSHGTYPLPAAGELKKIPLQGDMFFKIRQRNDGSYEGKFGPDSKPAPQPLPARLEERKKDAGGWAQIEVSPDGMLRVPGIPQPLYRPMPGQTQSVPVDAKTTFRFRRGEDGDVYGTFETKAPSPPPQGWQRVNVSPDGMIRLQNHTQPLYRPKPGQTESVKLDARTTFKYREAEDGEIHGTFETKAPSEPPPGWERVNVDSDGMIRLPNHAKSFYPPQPGKSESIQLDDKTTFLLSQTEDGEIYGTFETAPPEDQPELEIDESKREYEGVVSTRQVRGQKVVDVGSLGTLVAPAPGGHDSYLMGLDKLLVLHGRADGTVEVSTRKLGIESKNGGFKGALLPSDGTLEFADRQFDVSKLQPGQELKEDVRIDGKKFKVKMRMNHDGSVTVSGSHSQKKSFFQQVLGFVGKIAPFLAAIPGLGVVAVAAKVVTVFNAVKDFAQSFKNGNVLGMVGSAAGAVAGFSQGAFQAIASKVANLANVGQQVITTLKHGLGSGLLQVVSNGANLVSSLARAAGDLGQGSFQSGAYGVAQTAGNVAGYAFSADSAVKGDLLPAATQVAQQVASNAARTQPATEPRTGAQSPSGIQESLHSGTRLSPFDPNTLPIDPAVESAVFSGFTPGRSLDVISGSMGQDNLVGDGGVLVAQQPAGALTPQQSLLVKNGVGRFSAEELARAIMTVDSLRDGFRMFGDEDGVVTREEIASVTAKLKSAISRNNYLGLQITSSLSWFQNPKTYFTQVVATLEWLSSNYAAFSAQNPLRSFRVGSLNIDLSNSAGRRGMIDFEDVMQLKEMGLLKQEAGGNDFQKLLGDFNKQREAQQATTRELLEASKQSGGSGPGVINFNGRQYGNPKDKIGTDGNPYTVYEQLNVPAGQRRHELWWTPVSTQLVPNGFREYPK